MFSTGGQISEGGGAYFLGNMVPRGAKFPRKFGPGGPKFGGGANLLGHRPQSNFDQLDLLKHWLPRLEMLAYFTRRENMHFAPCMASYIFNYSFLLCYRINDIVLITVVLTLPSYMRKLPNVIKLCCIIISCSLQ